MISDLINYKKILMLFVIVYLMSLFIVHLLTGYSKTIEAKEAEDIAVQTAIKEGYTNPRLFTYSQNKTTETVQAYHFSPLKNKDVKTWRITLITDERDASLNLLGDIEYFIDIENGEIVEKISGVD